MASPQVRIKLLGNSRCQAEHLESGSLVETSAAPEFGGAGGNFSSTDLLITALGTCIGSSLEKVLERNNIGLDEVTIEVQKHLSQKPKNIAQIDVLITLPKVDERTEKLILNTCNTCVVKRALADFVEINTRLIWS